MNGSILGLSPTQIDELFNDIVQFAEIGEFIERPVKTYSSGMALRLAFAVQVVVPKEILIVDEALAVGDDFQRKCFLKIEEFKKQGGTILFVSHSGAAIVELCDRAVLLDSGEQLMIGQSKRVVNLYQKLVFAPADKIQDLKEEIRNTKQMSEVKTALINSDISIEETRANNNEPMYDPNFIPTESVFYESRGAQIYDPEITTMAGKRANILIAGQKYVYRYYVKFSENCTNVRFAMLIKSASGLELGGSQSAMFGSGEPFINNDERYKIEFTFVPRLATGVYFLNAGVLGVDGDSEVYLDRKIDLMAFKIMPSDDSLMTAIVDFEIAPECTSIVEKGVN